MQLRESNNSVNKAEDNKDKDNINKDKVLKKEEFNIK